MFFKSFLAANVRAVGHRLMLQFWTFLIGYPHPHTRQFRLSYKLSSLKILLLNDRKIYENVEIFMTHDTTSERNFIQNSEIDETWSTFDYMIQLVVIIGPCKKNSLVFLTNIFYNIFCNRYARKPQLFECLQTKCIAKSRKSSQKKYDYLITFHSIK